ncbi:MAG: replicative DNA helicase [Ignavibacteria bacterium]|nr:replicative DNA helicase [Ignavibacteria bacterium]
MYPSEFTSSDKAVTKYTGKSRKKNDMEIISPEMLGSKVPPHSTEAEMNVLGSMMIDRTAISKAIEILESDSFYHERNKKIYDAIVGLSERGVGVDILTIGEELLRRGQIEEVGGTFYLVEINNTTPTASNIEHHARIVQERYLKRCLISTSGVILNRCYDDTTDALDEIDYAESKIFEIAEKRLRRSYIGMRELASETFAMITAMMEGDQNGISGVPSGFVRLDEMLGGFQKSDLIIIAARPSMGKTAMALSIARNVAVEYQQAVGIFSIEMAATQLMMRLLSAESRINAHDIRSNRISHSMMPKLVETIGRLAEAPVLIDDSPALTIMEIRAKCRRMKAEHDVKMVIIDYLQLIQSPKAESREREISIISRSLKQIAKELNIPVIALAQLNRSVESRADKIPMLSDLRESGSLEQDADVVMFVNRLEQYGITTYEDGTPTEGTAEIIIGKQRNGPVGSVRLAYLKNYARFENLSLHFEEPAHFAGREFDNAAF